MRIVVLGLSITSSWGNGHATTFRSLIRHLDQAGHDVLFLERDKPWYADNRDMPEPPFGKTRLYDSLTELFDAYEPEVRTAEAVIVGSYVPEGAAVGDWVLRTARGVRAFYDIDTPVTLAQLSARECEYLEPEQIGRYDLYLSFTGGPILKMLESYYGSPMARAMYCSVDAELYSPIDDAPKLWDLGYLGTYSDDRQPTVDRLLIKPARQWPEGRFMVAGPQYPDVIDWPANVSRCQHLPPDRHRSFYNAQRLTLNVTRAAMRRAGYCPSVRLFEAAACGTPILSDNWPGLESLLMPGREIVLARSTRDALKALRETDEARLKAIGRAARDRILADHTSRQRASQLVSYLKSAMQCSAIPSGTYRPASRSKAGAGSRERKRSTV